MNCLRSKSGDGDGFFPVGVVSRIGDRGLSSWKASATGVVCLYCVIVCVWRRGELAYGVCDWLIIFSLFSILEFPEWLIISERGVRRDRCVLEIQFAQRFDNVFPFSLKNDGVDVICKVLGKMKVEGMLEENFMRKKFMLIWYPT